MMSSVLDLILPKIHTILPLSSLPCPIPSSSLISMSNPRLIKIDTPDYALSSAVHDENIAEFHSRLCSSRSSSLNFVSVSMVMSTTLLKLLKTACLFCWEDDIPPTFLHLTLRLAGLLLFTPAATLLPGHVLTWWFGLRLPWFQAVGGWTHFYCIGLIIYCYLMILYGYMVIL